MTDVTIVGAGLSGLSAGIILARQGHTVTVLEQLQKIGGASVYGSTVARSEVSFADMTPLDLSAMSSYLGFPLEDEDSGPFCNPLPVLRLRVYGKVVDLELPVAVQMKMVERGARESSIDSYLYRLACNAGVKFEFGSPVRTRKDFADLPPDSIIATGMFRHAFDALEIPYSRAHGYFAGGAAATDRSPYCVAYFDEQTRDYAYYASANGVGAAVLFQRNKRLSVEAMDWFPTRLAEDEGIEFPDWKLIDNLVGTPTGSFSSPRLFSGRLILTGTLSGMQDPSMVLGVHGALVSGRIAAMAVTDRAGAMSEFRRMNKWWKVAYAARRVLWATHPWGPRFAMPRVLNLAPRVDQRYVWMLTPAVPGWMRLPGQRFSAA